MFRWKCLSSSFTGGPRAGGTSSFFSMVLAHTKVHHAGYLLGGRERQNFAREISFKSGGDVDLFYKRGKPERPRGLFCSPFLCCEGVCCVAVSSCSCNRLSSSFISLSYSTHSGTILAAAVSFGSFVFGLLHYSRKKKADKTHHSRHQRRFLPASHIVVPSTVCGRRLNLIRFPILLKGH